MNNEELKHYGILGMKWGRRKARSTGTSTKRKRTRSMSADAKEAKRISKKKIYEMSNEELRKLNDRRNLERNYRSLNPSVVKKGVAIVAATAATMGSIVAVRNNGKQLLEMGRSIVNSTKYKQLRLF